MDFLRRLAPGRAAEPGAAHLDERPRWLAPSSTPPAAAPESPAADRLPAAAQAPRARAAALPGEREHTLRREPGGPAPAPPLGPGPAQPPPAPKDAAGRQAAGPAAAPPKAPPQAGAPRSSQASTVEPADRPAGHRQAPSDTPMAVRVRERPSASLPEATPDPLRQPLRIQALADWRAQPAREPRVVQVTIDRLDVRPPAVQAPVAPPRERRPRAPSAVAPLSDYLRGGGRP